ncbi:hypothetical protein MMC29_001303 [Sticta canariensis]|nr:hypothetical protein [Sticta canariensis]
MVRTQSQCLMTAGIGVETARALHATGADVFITARNRDKAQAAVDDIIRSSPGQGNLEILHLELDSLHSVREFAAAFPQHSKQLNVLITNAGVMACPESKTTDGLETQFGTNHVAHFLLFELLKPLLLQSSTPDFQSRVVSLSSRGHQFESVHLDDLDFKKRGYDKWKAYGQVCVTSALGCLHLLWPQYFGSSLQSQKHALHCCFLVFFSVAAIRALWNAAVLPHVLV